MSVSHPWWVPMNLAYTEESSRIAGAREVTAHASPLSAAGAKAGFELVTFTVDATWK